MSTSGVDGVELAVLSNRVEGAVLSMMNTLLRTGAFGGDQHGARLLVLRRDGDDELLPWRESLPIHVMGGPDLMAER